tara:strand:- start:314 stop:1261 length:948 start_codon:yes stop_codon:yes gene_type:complete
MSDALRDTGGISTLYQLAFNGHPYQGNIPKSDIIFTFSKFSAQNEIYNNSKCKYHVITGLPFDYNLNMLKPKAQIIRENLHAQGVKKIIAVFDENSPDDDRWHTGPILQKENYEYILNELMENQNLGIIFKPKTPGTLKKRMGKVYNLINDAINTGRCIILDKIEENNVGLTSSIPAILAGLASDLSVHCHLSAGTAALECASANIPVIVIDREGDPHSKLHQLPKGEVVFSNWKEAINAIRDFDVNDKNIKIGNWSSIINELDPFRDGLGAKRIGSYLNNIIEGYMSSCTANEIMIKSAELYMKKWGKDKIVFH